MAGRRKEPISPSFAEVRRASANTSPPITRQALSRVGPDPRVPLVKVIMVLVLLGGYKIGAVPFDG